MRGVRSEPDLLRQGQDGVEPLILERHTGGKTAAPLVVIVIAAEIAVVIAIPFMIVRDPAMFSFPIAVEPPFSVVVGTHPDRAGIGRPRPISIVPAVSTTDYVPIAVHPGIARPRGHRSDANHSRRWRRSNANSDRDLAEGSAHSQK